VRAAPSNAGAHAAASDDDLMADFCAGGSKNAAAAAFDALYARYKDKTWRYFLRQVDEHAARDCQQELWLKIIERRADYRAEGKFGAYLFTIAHSVLMDSHRKHLRLAARTAPLDADAVATEPQAGPQRLAGLARTLARLDGALRALPLAQRSAFLLRAAAGLSYAEIAAATDSNVEAVKSRLRYAKSKLREELADADL
jgi:RNA polymerase sigma-70 factor (ECF subfamily)